MPLAPGRTVNWRTPSTCHNHFHPGRTLPVSHLHPPCIPPPFHPHSISTRSFTTPLSTTQAEAAELSQAATPHADPSETPQSTIPSAGTPTPGGGPAGHKGLPILKLQPEIVQAGGLDLSAQPAEALTTYDNQLRQLFLMVNLQYPGLRVLNVVPPVFVVPGFLTHEECDQLVEGAKASGLMKTSGVSEHVGEQGAARRTSSTVAITTSVMREHALLAEGMQKLISKAANLLPDVQRAAERGAEDGALFKTPKQPRHVSLELPQVTRYEEGQHFLEHFDAFPPEVAQGKGYQRRGTLLLYLNDVHQGGATTFPSLGISVQPRKGTAVLFFPSFANGLLDPRMIHIAETAVDTKWVSQTWISCGLDENPAKDLAPKFASPLLAFKDKKAKKQKQKSTLRKKAKK